ncbi:MAG: LysM peptidoglycan-binding domain-containing protein [Verrucomicrobiota bacterium]|nr:LysM peptidoglycan-binding domain-containing protein [Verrucomicrobiota bacterium]
MKLILFLLVILIALSPERLSAQNAAAHAAALAERQEAAEKIKRLSGDVENLMAANASLQKNISALAEQVNQLRENQTKASHNSSFQEDLKRLAEKILEVDKKREADKELIVAQIKKMGEGLGAAPTNAKKTRTKKSGPADASAPDKSSSTESPEKNSTSEKGYEYVVQEGDFLSTIIAAYNADFKSKGMKTITSKQVLEANPGLKPERLVPGKKVFIPMPAP